MNKNKNKLTKEYQNRYKLGQFFTSDNLVEIISNVFKIDYNNKTILEPSFGGCAFIKYIVDHSINSSVTAVDIDNNLCKKYKNIYYNVNFVCHDYLTYKPKNKFDIIIGNPPFNLKTKNYYDSTEGFLSHALDMLNENGRLFFVLPSTVLRNKQYQSVREKIISNFKIEGIMNTSAYEFLGADIETIVIAIRKQKVNLQKYTYYNSKEVSHVELLDNPRKTININCFKYYNLINEKLSQTTIGDYFCVHRGNASESTSLRGRDLNFYNHYYDLKNGNNYFICLQNIAYRFTSNLVKGDISKISDTVTILDSNNGENKLQLCFYSEFLNSSIANYLLHVGSLNNCKLTIHIDKYYIFDIKLPSYDPNFTEYIAIANKVGNLKELAEIRNRYFYNLLNITQEEKNEIEKLWTYPRYKSKTKSILEV